MTKAIVIELDHENTCMSATEFESTEEGKAYMNSEEMEEANRECYLFYIKDGELKWTFN